MCAQQPDMVHCCSWYRKVRCKRAQCLRGRGCGASSGQSCRGGIWDCMLLAGCVQVWRLNVIVFFCCEFVSADYYPNPCLVAYTLLCQCLIVCLLL